MVVVVSAMGLSGCATQKVSDLDAYQVVPMNRVVPFPSDVEREKRVFEVNVVDRPAENLDEQTLRKPRVQVRTLRPRLSKSSPPSRPAETALNACSVHHRLSGPPSL